MNESQWSSRHGTETHFETQFQSLWHHFDISRFQRPVISLVLLSFSGVATARYTFTDLHLLITLPPPARRSTSTSACRCHPSLVLSKRAVVRIFALKSCVTSNKEKQMKYIETAIEKKKKSYFYRSKIELCSNVLYLIMEPKRPRGWAVERCSVVVNDFVTVKRGLNTVSGYNISP